MNILKNKKGHDLCPTNLFLSEAPPSTLYTNKYGTKGHAPDQDVNHSLTYSRVSSFWRFSDKRTRAIAQVYVNIEW